jgi:hypothetical protein
MRDQPNQTNAWNKIQILMLQHDSVVVTVMTESFLRTFCDCDCGIVILSLRDDYRDTMECRLLIKLWLLHRSRTTQYFSGRVKEI